MDRLSFARKLRSEQTKAEYLFWEAARSRRFHGLKFKRQVPIGNYIADFVCEHEKLIVELDGGQHDVETQKDDERTQALQNHGYRVVRYWNDDVIKNMDYVLEELKLVLGQE